MRFNLRDYVFEVLAFQALGFSTEEIVTMLNDTHDRKQSGQNSRLSRTRLRQFKRVRDSVLTLAKEYRELDRYGTTFDKKTQHSFGDWALLGLHTAGVIVAGVDTYRDGKNFIGLTPGLKP